jgi:hypothetical protein
LGPNYQIFTIKSVLYSKVINSENQLEQFGSFAKLTCC